MNTRLRAFRFSAVTRCTLLGLPLLATPLVHSAEPTNAVQGSLFVTATSVEIDRTQHVKFVPAEAQCFDHRGDALTCATLVGIGYVDKARVTLRGDSVVRIDIILLQQ